MNLVKSIFYVACFPRHGWREVKRNNIQSRDVQTRILYPMMALLSLTAFIALAYSHIALAYQNATLAGCIQHAIINFAKYFFTFLISGYILTGFFPSVVGSKQSANKVNVVIQYCMAIIIALNIIDNLLPTTFPYLKILYVYVFFVAWKADGYLEIKNSRDKNFLIILAAMIFLLPVVINYLLKLGFDLA